MKKRKGRGARPLAIKQSMHIVLRSAQAIGPQSFRRSKTEKLIASIMNKFCQKYGVRILSNANAGNHLHAHVQLSSRQGYKAFIRAVTGAIAQAISNAKRGQKLAKKFWDQRPFTRIVHGFKDKLSLNDYIEINRLEAMGYSRDEARDTNS